MMTDPLEGPQSAESLLKHYASFSVPHFQRGLVWDTAATALLLESLFLDTPCGSLILWTPSRVREYGVPLGDRPHYLIVDGQQRIRSLHDVLGGGEDAEAEAESEKDGILGEHDEEQAVVWCLNLGRLPEFNEEFPGGRRYKLFRRARDPRDRDLALDKDLRGAPIRDREALLPLLWFIDNDNQTILAQIEEDGHRPVARAASAVARNAQLSQRLRSMFRRPLFHVSVIGHGRPLAEVVGIYNRINSAGKRVEAEERAFASVVAEGAEANKSLARFFGDVEALNKDGVVEARHGGTGPLERDNRLRRQKESRFGFKLFMRAFALGLAYHGGRSVGSSSLSFDSVNPETLSKTEAGPHLQAILDSTANLCVQVASTLSQLGCDDLRMLPSTTSLWPLFQLLIRFPDLGSEAPEAVAAIALRLTLADVRKNELLDLCNKINSAEDAGRALALFDSHKGLKPEAIERAVQRGVDEALSLTAPYALILYWVLRRGGAADFLYENVPGKTEDLRRTYGRREAILCAAVKPEKQHIVPYARLKNIFPSESKRRPGRHEVNGIGNLTYISAGLNSFRTGVGSAPLNVAEEPQPNRDAHFLGDSDLLRAYQDACDHSAPTGPRVDRKSAKVRFRRFCRLRRKAIATRLVEWDQSLRAAARSLDDAVLECVPAARLVAPGLDDRVRSCHYPRPIVLGLVRLAGLPGMKQKRKEGVDLRIVFKTKAAGRRGTGVLQLDLHRDGTELGIKVTDEKLRAECDEKATGLDLTIVKSNKFILRTPASGAERVAVVLDWLAIRLPASD